MQELTPILISGAGRTGSTALMSLLSTDNRIALDRAYPFESRYLTYVVKFALLVQRPDCFPFLDGDKLFDLWQLGVTGVMPGPQYLSSSPPDAYLPRVSLQEWASQVWRFFSDGIVKKIPESRFYAEKVPLWVPPVTRTFLNCYTIYNLRDPRDIYLSANAFMRKRNQLGFGRKNSDTDLDYARSLAIAFVSTFEQYYADRDRPDTLLVRYEDFVTNRDRIVAQLCELTSITLADVDARYFDLHRTAKDLPSTLNRWEREPIPLPVVEFFESYLHDEMEHLGYRSSSRGKSLVNRSVSFANGGTELSTIPCSADGSLSPAQEGAIVDVDGVDYWIILPLEPFAAEDVKQVWVSVRGEIEGTFSLYWRSRDSNFSENRVINVGYSPLSGASVLVFPVHEHPEWKNTIFQLRLDLFNSVQAPHRGRGFIRWVRLVA
jgi:Sulfotransferase family